MLTCSTCCRRPDCHAQKSPPSSASSWKKDHFNSLSNTLDQCSGSGSLDPYTGLQIRIRILLFSSMAFEMQTKVKFFSKYFLLITYSRFIFRTVFKDKKSLRRFFSQLSARLWKDSGGQKTSGSYGSWSGTPLQTTMTPQRFKQETWRYRYHDS
jgi:hypothetical protein